MKNIVAAVDFSAVSINAVRYAVKMAEHYKANVWIYHAYELAVAHIEYGYPFVTAAELQNVAEFDMQELVKDLSNTLQQPAAINTRVEMSNLINGLHALCDEAKADMVVMGITGKGALTRLLTGSNTIHAIHHLHYPVLIIPAGSIFSPFQKIGFAADYEKAASPAAIDLINNIAGTFKASLHVINVDWNNRHFSDVAKQHQALLHPFHIANRMVTCGEFLGFIADGGYTQAQWWLSDGWAAVQAGGWQAPLYWIAPADPRAPSDEWQVFGLAGVAECDKARAQRAIARRFGFGDGAYGEHAGRLGQRRGQAKLFDRAGRESGDVARGVVAIAWALTNTTPSC